MSLLGTYTVYAEWLEEGALFLYGANGLRSIDPSELKDHLFAWHEPSFYGTFIETTAVGFKEGVKLSAPEALDFFCHTPTLLHADAVFSEEAADLKLLAPSIEQALATGAFMPDFEQWKHGQLGWKLDLPAEVRALASGPTARAFIEALAAERAGREPGLRASLQRLAQEPAAAPDAVAAMWLDEEDWLTAIGWVHDPSPYRVCLQLVEPEGGRGWRIAAQLQDREHPETLLPVSAEGIPADGSELPPEWADAPTRVTREVERWLRVAPLLREKDRPGQLAQELDEDAAWELLSRGALQLAEAGAAVLLPSWWERVRRTRPRLKAKVKSSVGAATGESLFGLDRILNFDWRLAIGGEELTEDEFRSLLEEKRRLIQFRGQWIQLDPAQLAQIREAMKRAKRRKGLTFREVMEMHLLGEVPAADRAQELAEEDRIMMELELDDSLSRLFQQLEHQEKIPLREAPSGFHGSLRRYQAEGMSWLLFLRSIGLGGCLADDMGLGKTIQWICYLLSVKEDHENDGEARDGGGPSLLICPTSVLGNWQKELERFAPSLKVHLHYGPNRLKGSAFAEAAQQADVVLTSYTLSHLDEEELKQLSWGSICLDEAQNIKNAYTKQASSIRRLNGYHRIAMTGTPIENRLTELWSIFDFLNPGYLGPLREFTHRFVNAIERENSDEPLGRVQQLVRPFLLRREKRDPAIRLDLPDKNEAKVYVSLTAEQASLYENHIQTMFERLEKSTSLERRGLILSSLTRLKQVCDHPSLMLHEGRASWRDRSNKLERLLDMVRELRSEGDRCLIFTQFVEAGHLLERAVREELGDQTLFLHGGTPRAQRDAMIAQFQDESLPEAERPGVFILSLRAGGIGLNLTAANHVFHFDRWWNPAVENQATDRAYRIGQTRLVQVHKFVTLGTLEERIDEMIERKLDLSSRIVGASENWITELSTDDLRDLFRLRREWIDS
ncbi:DEAD/DEAH box helicase [Gorillibacterium timonense]|uniref:DEAD/DEAH box helicase n=1 Tax=Gorillibacterium timonense TaxID=1689269 RepID=UPI00071C3908|nr:DEAD/DEAH box helicase [Gorillibacterium timonense]